MNVQRYAVRVSLAYHCCKGREYETCDQDDDCEYHWSNDAGFWLDVFKLVRIQRRVNDSANVPPNNGADMA